MASAERMPWVLSVQHFCLHDGPGIRSVVFLKGCPLRCSWCQNPESWRLDPEIGFKERLCIQCGSCARACRRGAGKGPVYRDQSLCLKCFACVDACPSGALVRLGERVTPEALVAQLEPEMPLLRDSGGGVTLSGGEPLLFPAFCADLARRLRRRRVPIAVETAGMWKPEACRPFLRETGLVLFDIKLFPGPEHRRQCGGTNTRIKKNLRLLAGSNRLHKLWPRMPLVPGITAVPANIEAWARLLRELGLRGLTIVPFHRMGNEKRSWLGLPPAPESAIPSGEDMAAAAAVFRRQGVEPFLPGEEDWSLCS